MRFQAKINKKLFYKVALFWIWVQPYCSYCHKLPAPQQKIMQDGLKYILSAFARISLYMNHIIVFKNMNRNRDYLCLNKIDVMKEFR